MSENTLITDISRKIGITIFGAVPAIMGGGIVFHFFGDFLSVAVYEIILLFAMIGFVSK